MGPQLGQSLIFKKANQTPSVTFMIILAPLTFHFKIYCEYLASFMNKLLHDYLTPLMNISTITINYE